MIRDLLDYPDKPAFWTGLILGCAIAVAWFLILITVGAV